MKKAAQKTAAKINNVVEDTPEFCSRAGRIDTGGALRDRLPRRSPARHVCA